MDEPRDFLGNVTFALGELLDSVPAKKREAMQRHCQTVVAWINDAVDLLRSLRMAHTAQGGAGWWLDDALAQRIDALCPQPQPKTGQ